MDHLATQVVFYHKMPCDMLGPFRAGGFESREHTYVLIYLALQLVEQKKLY